MASMTRTRKPRRLLTLAATLGGAALTTLAATMPSATGGPREDDATEAASGVQTLRAEIEAMVAAGLPPTDPKLALLQEDLAALEAGTGAAPRGEPGVVLSEQGIRDVEVDRRDASLWDHGEVPCEPIPPDLLTAADIAGASCRNEPQPDGSARYVAVRPDGGEIVVVFGADGTVTRLP
jgi:hypothetical protein